MATWRGPSLGFCPPVSYERSFAPRRGGVVPVLRAEHAQHVERPGPTGRRGEGPQSLVRRGRRQHLAVELDPAELGSMSRYGCDLRTATSCRSQSAAKVPRVSSCQPRPYKYALVGTLVNRPSRHDRAWSPPNPHILPLSGLLPPSPETLRIRLSQRPTMARRPKVSPFRPDLARFVAHMVLGPVTPDEQQQRCACRKSHPHL